MSLDLDELHAYCEYLDGQQGEVDVAAIVDAPLVTPMPLREPWATRRRFAVAAVVVIIAGVGLGLLLARDSESPPAAAPDLATDPTPDESAIGNGTRVVVSPLVENQATIVEQAQFEIFSVEVAAGGEDYWRIMSLDEFDGDLWKASSNFEPAVGVVPSDLDPSVLTRSVVQTITTRGLRNIYLPVAYELREVIDDGGISLEYETESGALVITPESYADSLDGFTYTIESAVPVVDGPRLRAASTGSLHSDFLDHHTRLPDDFPDSVRAEALRITAGATSDYDRALALQNHFRANFTYNINVALTHDVGSLETFLFEVREGYCEQFASAFAAMARSLGIPTRVAVGYTWGEWDPSRGAWVVRGEHAHAWPEVYFAGTGWVNFEPTPGRGGPHDTEVTGLQPQQAGSAPTVPTVPTTTIALDSATAGL